MHLFGTGVFERQTRRTGRPQSGSRLRALAVVAVTLASTVPSGWAQQAAPADRAASDLPTAPAPVLTEPLKLRPSARDFAIPNGRMWANPLKTYQPTTVAKASFVNSVRLGDMVKDGKIYLSLSDALALALENNFDIAIARYNLDIADTDILRSRTGASLRGVSTGIVENTLGGTSSTLTSGGGPGGTTGGSGGAGSGSSGLVLSTSGAGPTPESLDPEATAAIQIERKKTQATNLFSPAASTNTESYDFTYAQGFTPGTSLSISWNNSRTATDSTLSSYTPELSATFKATVTQHLLQGAGIWVNKRFMYQALNNRRITDSSFRQQILYTVNQVENIYWALVSSYEDVQAKQRALAQSAKLLDDNKKQLEIGTLAPLDVVNAESTVATDRQALISSQSNLNYQQQIIKQAIARSLNDPALMAAAVIPTDRISTEELPEESQPVEDLVKTAFTQRPELEQAFLQVKNNEITLRGARNALLPTLDAYGFYGASVIGGTINSKCTFSGVDCVKASSNTAPSGWGGTLTDMVNSTAPDKGVGFNLTIPIRNRTAQADQARSLLEYRQSELRLEQLYTQIRMQIVNAQFALTNDRAQVKASIAAEEYAKQSLDAETKKLRLGASTTANVLMQERNLATAENSLISANAAYAKDRAGLYQLMATTLQRYGINLEEATSGDVKAAPVIPGLQPAPKSAEPTTTAPSTR
jgi:outer membrane protein TolC